MIVQKKEIIPVFSGQKLAQIKWVKFETLTVQKNSNLSFICHEVSQLWMEKKNVFLIETLHLSKKQILLFPILESCIIC